jgi:hypothetical protein
LAAIFFCAMGTFAGVAALYLTSTRPLGHQAAEIVLFCLLFAIALFAVIALFQTAPNARRATRLKPIGDFHLKGTPEESVATIDYSFPKPGTTEPLFL